MSTGNKSKARFAHRWIVVTETQHVAQRNTFRTRSYADKRDAMSARDTASKGNGLFVRTYLVDRNNSPNINL